MQNHDLAKIRSEYLRGKLDLDYVDTDPFMQFGAWMDQALAAQVEEPTAMTLATVGEDSKPSARIVLLKGFSEKGFVFFTNYDSRKGSEISQNHHVALLLYWKELERQVRIEGSVCKTSVEESEAYFLSRPVESQVSAIISLQSSVIPDRQHIERLREQYLHDHSGKHVRPSSWGGYRLIPEMIEFWQGRTNRLHDRIRYSQLDGVWKIERLAP